MKRVKKYKNTGQQSRDFSATIRLSKKGGGAGSGVDSGGDIQPVTPYACIVGQSLFDGSTTTNLYKLAALSEMSIDEYMATSGCSGTSYTIDVTNTSIFGPTLDADGVHYFTGNFYGPIVSVFCRANDPNSVYFSCTWSPVNPVSTLPINTQASANGEMMTVSFIQLTSYGVDPLEAAGVFTVDCYADGVFVDTITITVQAGQTYLCTSGDPFGY